MKDASHRPTGTVWAVAILMAAVLAGCGTNKPKGGGYGMGDGDYRRDGPHANPPANLHAVPDAVPRIEPLASGPNRPYAIAGKRYVPDTSGRPYRVKGRASWYGRQFHGRPTSSGEPYDMYAMTAAHPTLPIPSYARVTRTDNGRSVIVRINDRGPFIDGRVIDLSYVAAYKLDTLAHGTGEVIVEWISPDDIRSGTALAKASPPPANPARSAPPQPLPATVVAAAGPAAYIAGNTPAAVVSPSAYISTNATAAATAGAATITPSSSTASPPVSLAIPIPAAPPPKVPTTLAAVSSGSSAFLQLGVFGEARNAHHLANRVRDSLANLADIEVIETDDRMYRVRLGPFSDRNTAVAHADTVYGQTGIRPYVMAPAR